MRQNVRNLLSGVLVLLMIACASLSSFASGDYETCPGRGERCAYVKVIGIKIWSKKDKGGPGIIVKSHQK